MAYEADKRHKSPLCTIFPLEDSCGPAGGALCNSPFLNSLAKYDKAGGFLGAFPSQETLKS